MMDLKRSMAPKMSKSARAKLDAAVRHALRRPTDEEYAKANGAR